MTERENDLDDLNALEARLRAILPEEYQDSYEDVQPVSMGSAGLKYGADGKVAWNDMWATFCDLAMAGGPPHKGTLLEPASTAEIEARFGRYEQVVDEICRGIRIVTNLLAQPSSIPGWVRVACPSEAAASWLSRAIVMENVSAYAEGKHLALPAGPGYRLEKEIKNVITVIAKTSHYWVGHMPRAQQRAIARLFAAIQAQSPLIEPVRASHGFGEDQLRRASAEIADRIHRDTELGAPQQWYAGWLGLECSSIGEAVWMMRALVASNVLARREGGVLFVPVNPVTDPAGDVVVRTVRQIHDFAVTRDVR